MTGTNITSHESLREAIRQILVNGIAFVRFQKVDGTIREMKCTLSPELLPDTPRTDAETISVNPDILRVYDMEKEDWRSFRVDSVKDFS